MSAPTPKEARALIRSLGRGTAGASGARFLHVGHQRWLAAQEELLLEIAEDGHAEARFVRGAYGAGKSHFLAIVQDRARRANWLTCHVECRADGVQIDRFETLLPQIVGKLDAGEDAAPSRSMPRDPLIQLLRRWTANLKRDARIRDGDISRPLEADRRMWTLLQDRFADTALHGDFVRALLVFARADLARDQAAASSIGRWMRGGERVRVSGVYLAVPGSTAADVDLQPIGVGNARAVMRGLLWLVRAAGYEGLLLCIDEVEEIAKLGSRRRQDQALQALREFVDHCGGEGDFRRLCLFLAATPEMFEGANWFPRYDALTTRIQPIGGGISWRGPVVDLDRTALAESDLRQMAENIREVFVIAHGEVARAIDLSPLVHEVSRSAYRIAKPRLLARVVVDALQNNREDPGGVIDAAQAIGEAALALDTEAA
ncbi:MAG: hypothetical protein E7812_02205 [Phenylobacterium sp.]|nr:MAG: hypothetical protein E7812_02205 [Phenylobacterium sp.]